MLRTRLLYTAPVSSATPAATPTHGSEQESEPIVGPPGPYGLLHRLPRVAPYLELARMEKPIGAPSLAPCV
jgi:hypothetical protein